MPTPTQGDSGSETSAKDGGKHRGHGAGSRRRACPAASASEVGRDANDINLAADLASGSGGANAHGVAGGGGGAGGAGGVHAPSGTTAVPQGIRLANVTFSYPSRPDRVVLRNLSLTLPKGKCTALVGPSGGGKTTIASLVLGVYHPDSGEVLLVRVVGRSISPQLGVNSTSPARLRVRPMERIRTCR